MITAITSERVETNCYIIEQDGHAIIIDPACIEKTVPVIDDKGLEPEFIFLTHEHFDHIWDLDAMRDRYDIPVLASALCSERIGSIKTNLSSIADMLSYYKTGKIPEEKGRRFTCRPAEITFEDAYVFKWRGHVFVFRRLPGHSPGSVIITMDDNTVFTGDYLIYGEEEITRLNGGSTEDYETIARPVLEQLADGTHICPGHGKDYIRVSGTENRNG